MYQSNKYKHTKMFQGSIVIKAGLSNFHKM